MSNSETVKISFNLSKSMIKVVKDVDEGIIPKEGDITSDGEVWVNKSEFRKI